MDGRFIRRETGQVGSSHFANVAGIIGAKTDNGFGIAGIDWNSQLLAYQISIGLTNDLFSTGANRIMAAVNDPDNVRVVNCSWGRPGNPEETGPLSLRRACAYAYKNNVLVVAASGNQAGAQIHFPAAFPEVLSVGSIQRTGARAPESNFGDYLDIVAPGSDQNNTDEEKIRTTGRGAGQYVRSNGTSLAAPHVSATASLMWAGNPDLSVDDVSEIMFRTADKSGATGNELGHGRLNASKALQKAVASADQIHFYTSGAYQESSDGPVDVTFYDAGLPGVNDGAYSCDRITMRTDIQFTDHVWLPMSSAWGRGVFTKGFSTESPNFSTGYAELVENSLTESGASFRTYIYRIRNTNPEVWVPCPPEEVEIGSTVTGPELLASPGANLTLGNNSLFVDVAWVDTFSTEFGYEIYRARKFFGDDPLEWQKVHSVPGNWTAWRDFGPFQGGYRYYYAIRVKGGAQYPGFGTIASVWTCYCPNMWDLNRDGFIDSTDLALQIDVTFFGLPAPTDFSCATSNSNLSCGAWITVVDLTWMIDRVFFGATYICDPCAGGGCGTCESSSE